MCNCLAAFLRLARESGGGDAIKLLLRLILRQTSTSTNTQPDRPQRLETGGWCKLRECRTGKSRTRRLEIHIDVYGVNQALKTRCPRMPQEEPNLASPPMDYCSRDLGGANRCQLCP
jgi:hypothetical protein